MSATLLMDRLRKSPPPLLAYAALTIGRWLTEGIASGGWGAWLGVVATTPFVLFVLLGFRIFWQLAIAFLVIGLLLFFGRHVPAWVGIVEVISLALLLLPSSRRYFAATRDGMPLWLTAHAREHGMRRAPIPFISMTYEEWLKGGVRYRKLRRVLAKAVPDPPIREFFLARQGPAESSARGNVLAWLAVREFVIALTDESVYLFKVSGIPLFSARIEGPIGHWNLQNADLVVHDSVASLGGIEYSLTPYHEDAATTIAVAVAEAQA